MLISGKKYHNSGLQPVVLGIVALYCYHYFILNTFPIILATPSKEGFCNTSIAKPKSNFSIHFSKCFVTVLNAPIISGIASTFLIFQILEISKFNSQ